MREGEFLDKFTRNGGLVGGSTLLAQGPHAVLAWVSGQTVTPANLAAGVVLLSGGTSSGTLTLPTGSGMDTLGMVKGDAIMTTLINGSTTSGCTTALAGATGMTLVAATTLAISSGKTLKIAKITDTTDAADGTYSVFPM